MATATNEVDEIRRKMALIRRELHEDVREVVAGAEAVTDWRRYVRASPWVAVGAAAAVGYLVVPKARRSVPGDIARQADLAEVREALQRSVESSSGTKETARKSLLGAAFAMAAPLAWRVAQNYAIAYLEQWIAQLQQQHMARAAHPPGHPEAPRPAPAPGRPGGADRPRGI